jgi:hypothetical protein
MLLAATTLRLASQWVSAVQVHFVQASVREIVGIPLELEIYDMMPFSSILRHHNIYEDLIY